MKGLCFFFSSMLVIAIYIMVTSLLFAQPGAVQGRDLQGGPLGSISATVVDSVSAEPLKFANVMLYDVSGENLITGMITDEKGRFNFKRIAPGTYSVSVKFMGYNRKNISGVEVTPRKPEVDLGIISLTPAVIEVGEVEVTAERPQITYQIDKKVINVSKYYTSKTGTAVDVLENVPSITVDVEDNVSLRGSGSFIVLIDGRRSPLEGSDALRQIPAASIENIEIITNPSAKYDPDGLAGIINVVLRKGKSNGVNGLFNINGGLDHKYGGDFTFSQKSDGIVLTIGGNLGKMQFPGKMKGESRTLHDTLETLVRSQGSMKWAHNPRGIRASIDWKPNQRDLFTFGGNIGWRDMERNGTFSYTQYPIVNGMEGDGDSYISLSGSERSGYFYSLNTGYEKNFLRDGHQLKFEIYGARSDGDDKNMTVTLRDGAGTEGRRTSESGTQRKMEGKVDYTLPMDSDREFESGYQIRLEDWNEKTRFDQYDPISKEYQYQEKYSHAIDYDQNVQSFYAILSDQVSRFGYQVGIRGEYTKRTISLLDSTKTFKIDEFDVFPTLHFLYRSSDTKQIIANYSRRIERPRSWDLEPFLTWMNAKNVRKGNPALKPEYTDSYELGYQMDFGRNSFFAEGYYRVTHNKIERISSVYDHENQVMLHTVANVGKDYSLGTELSLNTMVTAMWNLNLMANLYDYRVKGNLGDQNFSEESFTWNLRITNNLRITPTTRLQVTAMYNSPSASAQGSREGFLSTDMGLKQDFFGGKLSASLQIRDVFSSAKFESTSEGRGFYDHRIFERKSPMATVMLSYNFNNYRQERRRQQSSEESTEEMEFY
ncbi:MAG: TonB-dependent receptor domain-containing protein [bacterium]